jgi:hypothetical protein
MSIKVHITGDKSELSDREKQMIQAIVYLAQSSYHEQEALRHLTTGIHKFANAVDATTTLDLPPLAPMREHLKWFVETFFPGLSVEIIE